jgi:hypothetical protein
MQLPQPVPLIQAQPPQIQDQHNNPVFHPMIIHMILSTIHEMNIKLEKLSLLDELNNKMLHMEQKIEKYGSEIKDIRHDLREQSERLHNDFFSIFFFKVTGFWDSRKYQVILHGMASHI